MYIIIDLIKPLNIVVYMDTVQSSFILFYSQSNIFVSIQNQLKGMRITLGVFVPGKQCLNDDALLKHAFAILCNHLRISLSALSWILNNLFLSLSLIT